MDAGPGDRKQEHVNLYVRACGITGSKASSNIKEASLRSGRITSLKGAKARTDERLFEAF